MRREIPNLGLQLAIRQKRALPPVGTNITLWISTRIDRVYPMQYDSQKFELRETGVILLLTGGDKGTQRRNIAMALRLARLN